MTFVEALAGWRDFYIAAGAAAATLVGLLFVGLSLHIKVVVSHPDVRSLARATLTNFFVVLLVALVALAPTSTDKATMTGWMVGIALASIALVVRPTVDAMRMKRPRAFGTRVLFARFLVSALCYAALGVVAVVLAQGDYQAALNSIFVVVLVMLVVAVRNTWDLLVTVAEKR